MKSLFQMRKKVNARTLTMEPKTNSVMDAPLTTITSIGAEDTTPQNSNPKKCAALAVEETKEVMVTMVTIVMKSLFLMKKKVNARTLTMEPRTNSVMDAPLTTITSIGAETTTLQNSNLKKCAALAVEEATEVMVMTALFQMRKKMTALIQMRTMVKI